MISARTIGLRIPHARHRNWAGWTLVAVALAATGARIGEIPDHPLVLLRVLVSIVAIAFLVFGPAATFGRRAFAIVALEAAFGIATFALVDVPFVMDHQPQIGSITAALVDRLDRVEGRRI